MDNLKDYWLKLIIDLIAEEGIHISLMKIIRNYHFTIPGSVWKKPFSMSLTDFGYAKDGTKMSQLDRNYYNKEGIELAKKKLTDRLERDRDYSIVAFPLINKSKQMQSQGHCMQSLVLSYFQKGAKGGGDPEFYIDIFYRNTEAVKKFAIDLMFFQEKIIPDLLKGYNIPLKSVLFHFSNLYISSLFIFLTLPVIDEIELLEHMRLRDPDMFHVVKSRCHKFFTRGREYYSYRSRKQIHNIVLDAIEDRRIDGPRLLKYLEEVK